MLHHGRRLFRIRSPPFTTKIYVLWTFLPSFNSIGPQTIIHRSCWSKTNISSTNLRSFLRKVNVDCALAIRTRGQCWPFASHSNESLNWRMHKIDSSLSICKPFERSTYKEEFHCSHKSEHVLPVRKSFEWWSTRVSADFIRFTVCHHRRQLFEHSAPEMRF